MVVDDLNANGWRYTFKEVPSPADIELALGGKKDLIGN
jgi:nitrogen fixation protein